MQNNSVLAFAVVIGLLSCSCETVREKQQAEEYARQANYRTDLQIAFIRSNYELHNSTNKVIDNFSDEVNEIFEKIKIAKEQNKISKESWDMTLVIYQQTQNEITQARAEEQHRFNNPKENDSSAQGQSRILDNIGRLKAIIAEQ